MTRALILPLVAALLTQRAGAQAWHVGAKTGVSRVETTSREFTWGGSSSSSIFARLSFEETFGVQPELAHVRRSGISVVGTSTLRMVADYIELPLLLHAQMRPRAGVSPFLNVGPNVAFRVRCRLRFEGGGVLSDESCEGSQSVRSARFDFGLGAGAGIGFTIDGATLTIESRITTGLRHFVLPTDVADARSIGWSALAGLAFPLSRRAPAAPRPARTPLPIAALPERPPPPPSIAAPTIVELRAPGPAGPAGPLVHLTAEDVDVREVLFAISAATGVRVAVSPDIRKRVSAVLQGVSAEHAIQAIADVAGLTVQYPSVRGGTTIVFQAKPPRP